MSIRSDQRFRVTGMSESELLGLCDSRHAIPYSGARSYWTAEIYGFGRHIREYGYFPSFFPLRIFTDHGVGGADRPLKFELESGAPVQFYHSPRLVDEWRKLSRIPCYVLYSPFVFYRRRNGIYQRADARGTLFYVAHTTADIDDESDIELLIGQIQALPSDFQPVSVSLHMHDINKGLHRIFQKYRIPVHTAGNSNDHRFAARFYDILRNFKYSASNLPMSCLFYSVEMGIPHSLIGNKPAYNNKGNVNITSGRQFDPLKEWQSLQAIYDLFCGMNTEITQTQREFVERELGLNEGVSRLRMCFILYNALLSMVLFRIRRGLRRVFRVIFHREGR